MSWSGPSGGRSLGDRPSAREIFRDRIQRNPEVCSNCFRHIRDVFYPHDVALSKRGDHTITKQALVRYYIPKGERTQSARLPEETAAENPPSSCARCGSIRGSTVRPLPMGRAVAYGWELSRTLAAFDIVHSPLALGFVVAHRKRFPALASRDDETFEVAIATALPYTGPELSDVLRETGDDPARSAAVGADGRLAPPFAPALPAPADK